MCWFQESLVNTIKKVMIFTKQNRTNPGDRVLPQRAPGMGRQSLPPELWIEDEAWEL